MNLVHGAYRNQGLPAIEVLKEHLPTLISRAGLFALVTSVFTSSAPASGARAGASFYLAHEMAHLLVSSWEIRDQPEALRIIKKILPLVLATSAVAILVHLLDPKVYVHQMILLQIIMLPTGSLFR